ncbi:MAG TPA: 4-alpha-glucanotransferase [Roseiflexaceae bacterium]|nr:4-alpha-glucanotransferase [Roseiflexaceae bacterium]
MSETRTSGILLHPTSLPSRWGIGDLGAAAYAFVDFLEAARQQRWQVMPLGPTGYGDSPYQSFSSFAGNPLLVSPDLLLAEGLLAAEDVADAPGFPDAAVDYGAVIPYKQALLRRAFARFQAAASPEQRRVFETFRAGRALWLEDYALFMALKGTRGGAWPDWEPALARHEPDAVRRALADLSEEVTFQAFAQFLFFQQWERLRAYANERGVKIIGDIPIFVAYDSADVWGSRELFFIGEDNRPTVVAGVPPDYFSATGQLWGNPLYRWDALAAQGYRWWIERLRAVFALVDIVRLDHFRGFAAYWEVPAGEETAINGRWVPGPGAAVFEAARAALGELPIIAEDLGVITPDVEELRDRFGFPGMKVLQFAFGGSADAPYLPHNYTRPFVVYTGTHDNDTTLGWWNALDSGTRSHVQLYLGRSGEDISWDFIRLALASVADTAIIPLQDVLKLGSEARMNTPGRPAGNWSWRYTEGMLDSFAADRLRQLTELYGRVVEREQASEESGGDSG